MNEYEHKQQQRKERYLERSKKAQRESDVRYKTARRMGDAIPLGQPILIGHHSEKRDRNYRARIDNNYRKAFEADDKAKYYAGKADSVGRGGISRDDPEAVQKLKDELAKCEKAQERMKAANAVVRRFKDNPQAGIPELEKQGFKPEKAAELFKPDFCGRIGFPDYALTNNSGNMRRIRLRIAELEKSREVESAGPVEREYPGFKYLESEGRVQFVFPGKPSAEIRSVLKSWAFKWSPSRGAWVRFLNESGKYAAGAVIAKLTG